MAKAKAPKQSPAIIGEVGEDAKQPAAPVGNRWMFTGAAGSSVGRFDRGEKVEITGPASTFVAIGPGGKPTDSVAPVEKLRAMLSKAEEFLRLVERFGHDVPPRSMPANAIAQRYHVLGALLNEWGSPNAQSIRNIQYDDLLGDANLGAHELHRATTEIGAWFVGTLREPMERYAIPPALVERLATAVAGMRRDVQPEEITLTAANGSNLTTPKSESGETTNDTENDTGKKSGKKPRLLDYRAQACIREFQKQIKSDQTTTMKSVVEEYVSKNPDASFDGITRRINDNPHAWRMTAKTTQKRQR